MLNSEEQEQEQEKQPLTEVEVSIGNCVTRATTVNTEEVSGIVVADEVNKWNGNLCDCFSNIYPSMICSFACPNIYVPYLYGMLTNNKKMFHRCMFMIFLMSFSGYFISIKYDKSLGHMFIFASNIFVLSIANFLRNSTRKLKNIPGSACEDVCLTVFCTPCSIAQTGRTIMQYDKICDNI